MCCTVVEHEIGSLKRLPSRRAVGLEVYLSMEGVSIGAECPNCASFYGLRCKRNEGWSSLTVLLVVARKARRFLPTGRAVCPVLLPSAPYGRLGTGQPWRLADACRSGPCCPLLQLRRWLYRPICGQDLPPISDPPSPMSAFAEFTSVVGCEAGIK